jgi:putative DNA primase/helicase
LSADDFSRVKAAALQSIETLVQQWLPNGVRDGNEWCVGSRSGEAGQSMKIHLSGHKAGVWSDFSGDDGDAGGDLISLYAYIFQVSQWSACKAIAVDLGLALDKDRGGPPIPPRAKPAAPAQKETPPAQAGKGVEADPETKEKTPWVPLLPVPDGAPHYPKAHVVRGKPAHTWEYRDQQRRLLGIVCRFVDSSGKKVVVPCVYAEHPDTKKRDWRWIHFRDPRPLYLPAALRDGFPVLVVEGEKCADAAHAMLGEQYDVVSWPGGTKSAYKADWTPLSGRNVIIWPDADAQPFKKNHARAGETMPEADQPGVKCANKIADILIELGARVHLVDIPAPGVKPDGWDVADLIAEGVSREIVTEWLTRLRSPASVKAEPNAELPAWVTETPEGTFTPSAACASSITWDALYAMLIKTERNTVKGCRENVFMCMRYDPKLVGLVALDQFSQLQVKRRAAPWSSEIGEWTEADDFHLGLYLAKKYYLVLASIGEIEKAVAQAAREHAFDPVKEYMTKCADQWDKEARVEKAFPTYWGAMDSEYVRLIARMFFVGLVQRAFRPGVKHDYAPVFEGGQGEGKSTALAVLGGEWFADTPFRMGEKDGYLSIQGVLIYEIAELEQFNRSEVTAVKAFMSSSNDRYREPYGRRMKKVPRRTCFGATTNEDKYFKDPTGNRRFWPIKCGRIDLDALKRDRDQLMGEAVHLMRAGALWYPTRDQQVGLIQPHQDDREIPHEWIGRLYDYCEGLDSDGKPVMGSRLDKVSSRELITKALHIEIGKLGAAKRETMDVSTCMRKLGWVKKREEGGAREYYYMRPKPAETASSPATAGDGLHPEPEHYASEGGDVDLPI